MKEGTGAVPARQSEVKLRPEDVADPFLQHPIPQTRSGARKAGLYGEWEAPATATSDGLHWLQWCLFLAAVGMALLAVLHFRGLL